MRFAVLGSPVGHSLSPVMHNAAFSATGIDGVYEAREVDRDGFVASVAEVRDGALDGANVTMPHKRLAFELCDVPSASAERAGAVNTLSGFAGEVRGDNTDVVGIREAWRWAKLGEDVPVVILGSGSAAAAALLALEGRAIRVQARSLGSAHALIERTGVTATAAEWDDATAGAVVVNATPIGMDGQALDGRLLAGAVGLFDMAYGDDVTPAVAEMRRRGLPVAEGLDMLIGQAVASFEIWTDAMIDPAVMRKAALEELARRRRSGGE